MRCGAWQVLASISRPTAVPTASLRSNAVEAVEASSTYSSLATGVVQRAQDRFAIGSSLVSRSSECYTAPGKPSWRQAS